MRRSSRMRDMARSRRMRRDERSRGYRDREHSSRYGDMSYSKRENARYGRDGEYHRQYDRYYDYPMDYRRDYGEREYLEDDELMEWSKDLLDDVEDVKTVYHNVEL